MSDPVVVITEPVLQVEPGSSVHTEVRITNVGDQVERYSIEVCKGPAAPWADVVPSSVSLLPGEHKEVTVTFSPPRRPAAPAGSLDFGVSVISQVDRDRRSVVEGDVAVGVIHGLQPALVPISRRGRHRGCYRLDIENAGSAPTEVSVKASDPGQSLSFALSPPRLSIRAGVRASTFLLLRPVRPTLFGRDESIPFWVEYRSNDVPEQTGRVDSVFVRRSVLPRAVLPAVIAVLTVAVLAVLAMVLLVPKHQPAVLAAAVPDAPILREVRAEAGGVKITWEQVPLAAGYKITRTLASDSKDVEDVQEVKPDVNVFTWKDPGIGQQCFSVTAADATGSSDPSPAQCTTVVEDPAAASAGAVSGAYVVYGKPYPQSVVDSFNQAQAGEKNISTAGFQVKFADSRSSKIPVTEPAYLLFQDGFADLDQARVYCTRVPASLGGCQPFPPIN